MNNFEKCPFCGKTETLRIVCSSEQWDEDLGEFPHTDAYAVCCDASDENKRRGCGATGGYQLTKSKAVDAWNKRS